MLRWLGIKTLFSHRRTLLKVSTKLDELKMLLIYLCFCMISI